jgi:transcriptional regulator GlxA family with amidase domain
MADNVKELKAENEQLKAENAELKHQLDYTREQFVRLMSRNLDLSDRIEGDLEFRRRVDVARELIEMNVERMRNADLRDDTQLMAIVEEKVESERLHLDPDFDTVALAKLIGVSKERMERLFRNKSIYRTPEGYIDNLRLLAAMRLLREKPNYNIASISEDAGFKHVRTMQRKLMDALGLTPAEYRALYTKDL